MTTKAGSHRSVRGRPGLWVTAAGLLVVAATRHQAIDSPAVEGREATISIEAILADERPYWTDSDFGRALRTLSKSNSGGTESREAGRLVAWGSPLLRGCTHGEARARRALVYGSLGSLGLAAGTLDVCREDLERADDPESLAGAARCLAESGENPPWAIPALQRVLRPELLDASVCLSIGDPAEVTTAQSEARRALSRIGAAEGSGDCCARRAESRRTGPAGVGASVGAFLQRATWSPALGEAAAVVGRPAILTFFYSSCRNLKKCSSTLAKVVSIRDALEADPGGAPFHVLAITLDPLNDSPRALLASSGSLGMGPGGPVHLGRLPPAELDVLLTMLDFPITRSGSQIVGHGVRYYVLDSSGLVVASLEAAEATTERLLDLVRPKPR